MFELHKDVRFYYDKTVFTKFFSFYSKKLYKLIGMQIYSAVIDSHIDICCANSCSVYVASAYDGSAWH